MGAMAQKPAKPVEKHEENAYDAIVRATANYQVKDLANDVRQFLENGGLRTEFKQVSAKKYSTVLFIREPANLKIGQSNKIEGGTSQTASDVMTTIPAGLYIFNYDTEGGLSLRPASWDPARLVSIALSQAPSSLSPEAYKINLASKTDPNLGMAKKWIEDTKAMYSINPTMASVMEGFIAECYPPKQDARIMDTLRRLSVLEQAQNPQALGRAKDFVRGLMGNLEEKVVSNLSAMIADMSLTEFSTLTTNLKITSRRDEARREMLLSNKPVTRMVVGFAPNENSGINMLVWKGTILSGDKNDAAHNPLLLYVIKATGKSEVEFPNIYSKKSRGPMAGPDYDNAKAISSAFGEVPAENALTSAFRRQNDQGMFGQDVKIFPMLITVPEAELKKQIPDVKAPPQAKPQTPKLHMKDTIISRKDTSKTI
jgi:hypothetical protein